jgi:hypothetical protein
MPDADPMKSSGADELSQQASNYQQRLVELLRAARKAYVEQGGRFLTREQLDDFHDEMRGRSS